MRVVLKRGPLVEDDMLEEPVVAAGDCHILAATRWSTRSSLCTV